jgi:methyl-accepting chemotaxis protein
MWVAVEGAHNFLPHLGSGMMGGMTKPSNSSVTPDTEQVDLEEEAGARPKPRFGISAKTILAMLVVGLLPLAVFGGVTLKRYGDRLRLEAELSMQASADRISDQVDEWIDKNVRVLQAAANLPAVVSMKQESQTEVLTAVQQAYPWMYLVFTVGLDGKNVARSDGKPLEDYSDRQYYKDIAAGTRAVSWQNVIGKTSKRPALVMALPIKNGNRTVGVMAAAMNIEDMSRTVVSWRTGRTGFAFLVDEKAKVVAHPNVELVLAQTPLSNHVLVASSATSGASRLVGFTEADGRPVLGSSQRTKFRWTVAVQQDEEELLAPLKETLTLGLWLLGGAAIFVALVARFAAKMLTKPIVELTDAADQMSVGALGVPITSNRHDELGQLAEALDRVRKSMAAAMSRLRNR